MFVTSESLLEWRNVKLKLTVVEFMAIQVGRHIFMGTRTNKKSEYGNYNKFDFAARVINPGIILSSDIIESNSKKEFLKKLSKINLNGYLQGPL